MSENTHINTPHIVTESAEVLSDTLKTPLLSSEVMEALDCIGEYADRIDGELKRFERPTDRDFGALRSRDGTRSWPIGSINVLIREVIC